MAVERNNRDIQGVTQETPIGTTDIGDEPFVETAFDDGSVQFDFDQDAVNDILQEGVININDDHYANLAEDMDDKLLNKLGQDALDRFQGDKDSRSDWLETINEGLSLLGIDVEETDDPFPGACTAHHPLILEAAVKFQAKASNELFSAKGPVRTAVIGERNEEKEEQAARVRNHMNYQVMNQMDEYFDETELLLFYLPIVGSGFKKTYYDPLLDRPVSSFVPVDKFVVNYYTTSLKTASCFTHVIDRISNDLLKDQVSGFYRDVDLLTPVQTEETETEETVGELLGLYPQADDPVFTLIEQYCYLHLEDDPEHDKDEIAFPYIITVEKETGTVLSIRRNWREGDSLRTLINPFTHYKFVPGLSFYGLGFIHLLGNLQMTLTSAMRSLVDSGAFATLQGGFVDKRLRIRNNDGPIAPGEFKEVEAGGMALKDAIVNLPFKEPSMVLLQMYQFIEARGQKFADSTEQVISDSTNYGPVGTTMALLEASEKFFTGVHKRLHKAQKNDFRILAAINYEYLGESETFDTIGNTFDISKDDYDATIDVIPVSDPNIGSQAQKLTLAQAIYTAALQQPMIHDMHEVSKYYYNSIGIDDDEIDKLLPAPDQPEESDPMTDLLKVQQSQPIKAFPGQNHDAHIQVKTAFLQDPESGMSPAMAPLVPLIQANIQEHAILKFQEQTAGAAQGSTEEIVIAQAAQQVQQQNQRIAELEAVGPDEARTKLADAELQRVSNETIKIENEMEEAVADRALEALKIQLNKYAEDNKLLIAQFQTDSSENSIRMKEMNDLIKESMKIQAAAESQDKQLEATPKDIPDEGVDKE